MADEGLNVDAAVDSIVGDIGISTNNEDVDAENEASTAQDQAAADAGADTGSGDVQAAAPDGDPQVVAQVAVRQAPKAWAKEKHEIWSKLDPAAQEYIEHREKQMLDGLSQYSNDAKFAKEVRDIINPHMELIRQQNIQPSQAIGYLLNAHRNLTLGTPEQKIAYLGQIAKTYGLDLAKATVQAQQQADEPAWAREIRERTERLERERQQEVSERQKAESARVEKQVTEFAEAKDEKGTPKHPYFDECAEDIVALVNAGHTLEQAYEKAVFANPVTRAKEIARLKSEEDAALRAKAKKEADTRRNASSTNVNSRDTRREPTAPKAKKWEDTLDATMRDIRQRDTH